eukprot:2562963-Amphidinium_carterae.1
MRILNLDCGAPNSGAKLKPKERTKRIVAPHYFSSCSCALGTEGSIPLQPLCKSLLFVFNPPLLLLSSVCPDQQHVCFQQDQVEVPEGGRQIPAQE